MSYPSSKFFSMTAKKETDCVFKSDLATTKDALFPSGLRGLGGLGEDLNLLHRLV